MFFEVTDIEKMLLLITQTSAFEGGEVGNRRGETVITLESQLLNDFIKKKKNFQCSHLL